MKKLLITGVCWLIFVTGMAQQSRRARLDSLYNDPFFYSTVSAVLLPKGFFEINNVSTLQTTTRLFNDQFQTEDLNARATAFSNLLQVTYGVSPDSRFNLGADVTYTTLRIDLNTRSSPWKVFGNDSAFAQSRGISTVGLRFRWKPLRYNRRFVIQGQLNQPVRQASTSPVSMRLQAVYVAELSRRLYLYTQAGLVYAFPRRQLRGLLSVPMAALLQYQVRPTFGILGVVAGSLVINQNRENTLQIQNLGIQLGPGLQWQPSLRFGLTTFYTWSVLGQNTVAYNSFTIGLRTII